MSVADLQIFAKSQKTTIGYSEGTKLWPGILKLDILSFHHRIARFFDVYMALNGGFEVPVQI